MTALRWNTRNLTSLVSILQSSVCFIHQAMNLHGQEASAFISSPNMQRSSLPEYLLPRKRCITPTTDPLADFTMLTEFTEHAGPVPLVSTNPPTCGHGGIYLLP